jgi:plastocyanin
MVLRIKMSWRAAKQSLYHDVIGAVLMVGALVVLAGCSAVEKPYVIDMTQTNSFFPATVVVPQGATVIWKNRDHEVHSTVQMPELALNAEAADDASGTPLWDSGAVASGETWELHFDAPGHYLFACHFHDEMVGTVIVTEAAPPD